MNEKFTLFDPSLDSEKLTEKAFEREPGEFSLANMAFSEIETPHSFRYYVSSPYPYKFEAERLIPLTWTRYINYVYRKDPGVY